ncbi:TolC family protein [Desulfurobacterium thermolithotrophum]|uniref:TolC family protein n=1 Tax=Desulfurobacterium thermolithotrophum TaxID=64160 RepID=UPI0013D2CE64|nr:TolC family protein [Desulfurobacterium thermolithotrophum]
MSKSILLLLVLFFFSLKNSYAVTISQLKSLIDRYSLEIGIEKTAIEKSKLLRKATFRSYFPRISLTGEVDEFYPYTGFFSKSWNQQYTLGISVSANPLNLQRNVQLKVDKYSIEVNKDALEKTRLELYSQAINYLLKLKTLEKLIEIRKELLRSSKEILKISEKKYKNGLVLITDVLKSKANVEKAKTSLRNTEKEYSQAFNLLNELVNFSLKTGEKAEVELLEEVKLPKIKKLISIALLKRPEIYKLKKEIEIAKLNVEIQKKTLSPQLNFSASYTRSGTAFFPDKDNYQLSAVLSFPIFDSGVTKLKSLAVTKDLISKELSLKKQENAIKREVLNAVEAVNSAMEEVKSAKSFLNYSKEAYKRVLNEYKLGVSDIVALLQAFDNLKTAEESYINSLFNLNSAYYELKKATGELLYGGKK